MTLLHYLGLTPKHRSNYLAGIQQSTPAAILKAVTAYTGISFEALQSKTRKREVAETRHIAMYLMRTCTEMTLKEIGDLFRRGHSTVMYAIDVVGDLLETDKDFEKLYEGIKGRIN